MSTEALQSQVGPVTPQRIEELGRIIMAFSEVTDRLQQSHDQLTRTVQHLRTELSEKNHLLERKNRLAALGEMAAGMAHEIRNPLGGIQLYASLLASDVIDRPASHELVTKISKGVKRLESIVSQVLQFSRDIRIDPSECDLAEIVAQAIEFAFSGRPSDGIRCECTGTAPITVNIDQHLIGQCVLNLLLNAIDAMQETGGTLHIDFAAPPTGSDAKQFHLIVRDTGPGIPGDVLDRIFNPFFTTKDSGTGLGLSIVHRVVEAHDGTIIAGNCDDGGAKFEIRI
jgi:signal transduction histidine kinase